MRALVSYFQDCDLAFFGDDDAQEVAGDQFADFACSPCPFDPAGHLFKTACGETKCIRCGEVSWS